MAKNIMIEEIDKETRIKNHDLKQKYKFKDKLKQEKSMAKSKSKKGNKKNWLKDYEIYGDEYEYDYDE